MINNDNILDGLKGAALWCSADSDATDLAQGVSHVLEKNMTDISVVPNSVPIVWPWLENKKVNIFSRFYLSDNSLDAVSEITEKINTSFKHGADGAQIFLSLRNLSAFVSQLYLIRDDLFFNKSVFIGMDIEDIGPFDWKSVFSELKKMRTSGLLLALPKDTGNDSDFVGRLYAALNEWNADELKLHFMLGKNSERIEQAYRLVQALRPDLLSDVRFFING